MRSKVYGVAAALAVATLSFAANATPITTLVDAGQFPGNDCNGGGFATCHAETTGAHPGGEGSPVIYKRESDDDEDFGTFATIDGSEFVLLFDSTSHVLSWTYTPGAGDPEIHFFDIKQGNSYHLYYDLTNPITTFSLDLDTIGYNAFSHVTWFDTGSTTDVPEPGTLAVLGAGLLALGGMLWRGRRRNT